MTKKIKMKRIKEKGCVRIALSVFLHSALSNKVLKPSSSEAPRETQVPILSPGRLGKRRDEKRQEEKRRGLWDPPSSLFSCVNVFQSFTY